MTLDDVRKIIRPLAVRVANLLSRAVVSLVDDGTGLQTLQVDVLADETRGDVERFQQYGFTCVPLEGAEAVVLFVGGRRDHGLAVAVDDRRHRLTGLQPGEVALYHKDGATVVLKADGSIELNPKPGAVVKLAGESDAVALASKVEADFTALKNAISAAPVAPGDGGASFKAALSAALTAWPASVGSVKVKAS